MKFSRDSVRTGGVGDRETTDLDRRSADSVQMHWHVKEVDYSKNPPVYRAERGDPNDSDDYNLTDWLPASGSRAKGDVSTHFLEVGEPVTLLAEGGELATAQLIPAGMYADADGQRPGTQKAGVWQHKFANGQEVSLDRETGEFKIIAAGQSQGDNSQTIDGKVTIQAAQGSIVMDGGTTTVTMGDAVLALSKTTFSLTVAGVKVLVDQGTSGGQIRIRIKDTKWRFDEFGLKQEGGALDATQGGLPPIGDF